MGEKKTKLIDWSAKPCLAEYWKLTMYIYTDMHIPPFEYLKLDLLLFCPVHLSVYTPVAKKETSVLSHLTSVQNKCIIDKHQHSNAFWYIAYYFKISTNLTRSLFLQSRSPTETHPKMHRLASKSPFTTKKEITTQQLLSDIMRVCANRKVYGDLVELSKCLWNRKQWKPFFLV